MSEAFPAPSIYVLVGLTPECQSWIDENIHAEDYQRLGSGISTGHRYIDDIADALNEAGFQDKEDYWIYY